MSEYALENEIRFSRMLKSERLPTLFKHLVYIMGTVVRDPDLSRNTKVETLARDNGSVVSYAITEYFKYLFLSLLCYMYNYISWHNKKRKEKRTLTVHLPILCNLT